MFLRYQMITQDEVEQLRASLKEADHIQTNRKDVAAVLQNNWDPQKKYQGQSRDKKQKSQPQNLLSIHTKYLINLSILYT